MKELNTSLPGFNTGQNNTEDENIALSIVIPLYNEEKRFFRFYHGIKDFMKTTKHIKYELIFVNDGSSDNTAQLLNKLTNEIENSSNTTCRCTITVDLENNQGKASALKYGVLLARGEWVLTADADMSTPISEVVSWQNKGYIDLNKSAEEAAHQVYIGNRRHENVDNGLMRSLMSYTFSVLTKLVVGVSSNDTQCGFKLYSKQVATKAFSELQEHGWAHDIEILKRIEKDGHDCMPIPVPWVAVDGSKVNVVRDTLKMFLALFKIRYNVQSS